MTGRHARPVSPLAALDDVERDNVRRRALALADQAEAWAAGPWQAPFDPYPWIGQAVAVLKELAK